MLKPSARLKANKEMLPQNIESTNPPLSDSDWGEFNFHCSAACFGTLGNAKRNEDQDEEGEEAPDPEEEGREDEETQRSRKSRVSGCYTFSRYC